MLQAATILTWVDPAHAGMILDVKHKEVLMMSGPRACGDDPLFKKLINIWV